MMCVPWLSFAFACLLACRWRDVHMWKERQCSTCLVGRLPGLESGTREEQEQTVVKRGEKDLKKKTSNCKVHLSPIERNPSSVEIDLLPIIYLNH